MNANDKQHRAILQNIAQRVMLERSLLSDFSDEALAELGKIQLPATMNSEPVRRTGYDRLQYLEPLRRFYRSSDTVGRDPRG